MQRLPFIIVVCVVLIGALAAGCPKRAQVDCNEVNVLWGKLPVDVHAGASEKAPVSFKLEAGQLARVEQQEVIGVHKWYGIQRHADDQRGFVRATDVQCTNAPLPERKVAAKEPVTVKPLPRPQSSGGGGSGSCSAYAERDVMAAALLALIIAFGKSARTRRR